MDAFCGSPGAVDIGLNLRERDGAARDRTIFVEDRVMAVLPALIGQALIGEPPIFHEAVAIAVAMLIDPFEGCIQMRQQAGDEGPVARSFQIGASQHDEQRR